TLLRAFVLNSPVLAEKVKEASGYPYMELREFVAKLIESYSKIEGVEESKDKGIKVAVAKALAWLLHETGGPVAEAISASVDTAAAKVLYATLCMRTKQLFEFKAVYGSANQWVNYIARQMQEVMPGRQKISVQDLKKQLQDKANAGGGADPQIKAKQFVPVESPATEAAALAGVKAKPGFEKLAGATLTPDVVETIYMPKFRLMTKGEPGFAGIGAIFSAINLRFAREELKKANRFNQSEAGIKFNNAIGGLVASVAQYGSAAIDTFGKAGAQLGTGWLRLERFLNVAGRYGGAVVGLVSAAIDIYHAVQDFKEGNVTMFILDAASAVVGLALAYSVIFLSASAAAVVALPLLLIAALIGILINYFKGKEVDEWLERCFFGLKEAKERFPTLAEDQKAFTAMLS
ncbi:T6SS effector BTH_I2691 family protein, partial [Burkholderia pseudomallei]